MGASYELELVSAPEISEPGRSSAPTPIQPPMVFVTPTWQYKHLVRRAPEEALLNDAELNTLGAEGWELVSVHAEGTDVHFYFKRARS